MLGHGPAARADASRDRTECRTQTAAPTVAVGGWGVAVVGPPALISPFPSHHPIIIPFPLPQAFIQPPYIPLPTSFSRYLGRRANDGLHLSALVLCQFRVIAYQCDTVQNMPLTRL